MHYSYKLNLFEEHFSIVTIFKSEQNLCVLHYTALVRVSHHGKWCHETYSFFTGKHEFIYALLGILLSE